MPFICGQPHLYTQIPKIKNVKMISSAPDLPPVKAYEFEMATSPYGRPGLQRCFRCHPPIGLPAWRIFEICILGFSWRTIFFHVQNAWTRKPLYIAWHTFCISLLKQLFWINIASTHGGCHETRYQEKGVFSSAAGNESTSGPWVDLTFMYVLCCFG